MPICRLYSAAKLRPMVSVNAIFSFTVADAMLSLTWCMTEARYLACKAVGVPNLF